MQPQTQQQPGHLTQDRYINQTDVLSRTCLSANTIRGLEEQGRFPKRRALSKRAVRWWLPDVLAWLDNPEGWTPMPS